MYLLDDSQVSLSGGGGPPSFYESPDILLIVPHRGGLSSAHRGCGCGGSLCSVFCVLAGSLLGSLRLILRSLCRSVRLLSLLS